MYVHMNNKGMDFGRIIRQNNGKLACVHSAAKGNGRQCVR